MHPFEIILAGLRPGGRNVVKIDAVAQMLWPDDLYEKKKLAEKPREEVVSKQYKETCFSCGGTFWAKNWHEPPSCPLCRRSRVD